MSEDAEPMTPDPSSTDPDRSLDLLDDPETARRYLQWLAVALLALLAVVATFRVYAGASAAIGQFVAPEFRPLFQAAFNLAVLLLAVAGISVLLRRLQAAA